MSNYRDYVFKDGRFVGEFEKMYQESDEIPWHQDSTAYMVFSDINVGVLNHFPFRRFCEIGCGMGYFTARVKSEMRFDHPVECLGLDVSQDAVQRAAELHKDIQFEQCDILDRGACEDLVKRHGRFDMLLIKEVMWYILDDLQTFYENTLGLLSENGYLLLSQSFPETENYFGKEIFPDPKAMEAFIGRELEFKYRCIEADSKSNGRELLHYVGQKKS